MPKRLLRGVIDFGDNKISVENLNVNYNRLSKSGFEWHNPDERKLWGFVKGYVQNYHEAPSGAVIVDYFERLNEVTVVEKLADVKAVEVYVRTHYATLLEQLVEDQTQNQVRKLLQEVEEIVTKGHVVNKEVLKGVKAGLLYFNQKIYEAIPPDTNALIEGDITQDTDALWQAFQEAKINKGNVYGKFTGIDKIDVTCHGIKPGELWVHAAAPGQLKTTFSLNWCYNLVTRYRSNVLYVSLEMKYEHLRRMVGVMHTTNGKFRAQGYKSLDYRKVRDGELDSPEDEAFYRIALKDFGENKEYHRFKVWAPDHDVTIGDIRVYAELLQKSMDIGLIVIDHGGLVKSSKPNKDYTVELNAVMREAKKLALHFNGGAGIPVLMLFQINRQGLDAVEKKRGTPDEGKYTFSALSYANECLVKGTPVKTDRGYVSIEQVTTRDKVWSRKGWKDVLDTFEQGVKPVMRVVVDNGAFIEVTGTHRLRVLQDNGEVGWKKVKDLKIGDFLVGDFNSRPFPTEVPELPPLSETLKVEVPTHLTNHLAYLIGVYQARGLFDHDFTVGYLGGLDSPKLRVAIEKAFLLTFDEFIGDVQHPAMKTWLRSIGMDHSLVGVAPIITRAPREMVIEYLKGFCDVMLKEDLSSIEQSGYLKCFQEIQMLFADLGIDSKVNVISEYESKFFILNHSIDDFRRMFPFVDPEKRAASLRYGSRQKWDWKVPFRGVLSRRPVKRTTMSAKMWMKLAEALGVPNRLDGIRPLQIVRIDPLQDPVPTYDIQVSGDHEYATAGFLSHNCERSADYVTTTYLNEELKKQGITKMGNLKNRDNNLFELTNVRVDFSCRRMWNWEVTDQVDIGHSGMDANTLAMFEGIL